MTSAFSENYQIQELEPCDPMRDKYVRPMSVLANMSNSVPWQVQLETSVTRLLVSTMSHQTIFSPSLHTIF